MKFTKMHGLGNDFIIIEEEQTGKYSDYTVLAQKLCDRHFGIGADGLLIVAKSQIADIKMRIFNADGSEAEMCGNGIRCFAKYVYERGILKKDKFEVETLAGVIVPTLYIKNGIVDSVMVDMGKPVFDDAIEDLPIEAGDRHFNITYVNMGVPHVVVFMEEINVEDILKYGPIIEHHKLFPHGTNVNFVKIGNRDDIYVRTWERGVGLTLACGTGTCASAVAACKSGRAPEKLTAHLAAGDLRIEWVQNGNVYMYGPAEIVFDGSIELSK